VKSYAKSLIIIAETLNVSNVNRC